MWNLNNNTPFILCEESVFYFDSYPTVSLLWRQRCRNLCCEHKFKNHSQNEEVGIQYPSAVAPSFRSWILIQCKSCEAPSKLGPHPKVRNLACKVHPHNNPPIPTCRIMVGKVPSARSLKKLAISLQNMEQFRWGPAHSSFHLGMS